MSKGIIFSAPMVLANRAGRKSQTRRLMKPQPVGEPASLEAWASGLAGTCGATPTDEELAAKVERLRGRVFPFRSPDRAGLYSPTPRYQPGDVVYVKETWAVSAVRGNKVQVNYMADDWLAVLDDVCHDDREKARRLERKGPRSPLHMPAWAARDWIKIVSVRVERLKDISEEDAIAEGIVAEPAYMIENRAAGSGVLAEDADCWNSYRTAREAYAALIDSINGPGTWESNAWCWVYGYERAEAAK